MLGPGKPYALLTYLALAPGRRASRDTLIDLLWADLDPDRARRALRQALFHLRRLIGEDTLTGTEELTLGAGVTTDRDSFLAALERDDLEEAIVSYRGEFLPSFGVPGGAAFEQWADLERVRLRASVVRAGELLVRRYLNQSQFKEAKRVARTVRDHAPGEEAAWRLVLESAVSARDFVGASVEASALEEWAATEAVILDAPTRAAITRARRMAPTAAGDDGAHELVAELTGREREFFVITAAWEAVRNGGARHVHVSANAGLGKTRLLHDALHRLAATGATCVSLRGTPGDRDVPYSFAADMAAALTAMPGAAGIAPASAATLLALNPALSAWIPGEADTASREEVLLRRILALADLVHSVAHEQRFVLAIDDVHWIDTPSLRVLEGVLNRLADARVLCVTAARPERRLGTERSVLLSLTPLTAEQVGALAAALGALPPDAPWTTEFVTGLYLASRGSPLLVLETLRLAMDRQMLALEQGEWRAIDRERLRRLLTAGEALRERVRALPDGARELLALLAIAGAPLDSNALAAVAATSPEDLAARVAPLEQQGLAVHTASGWMPAHDEIAEAARNALDDTQRAAAERRLGAQYARAAGGDALTLMRAARHALAAGDEDGVRALFLRYAQGARVRGDRRTFGDIAAEFVGDDAVVAKRLADAVPLLWRAGLWSRTRRRIALAVAAAVPALASTGTWISAERNAALPRVIYADSSVGVTAVVARAEFWDGRSAPVARVRASSALAPMAAANPEFPPAISPDGRSAAWIQASGDSTTLDIWIRTPAGVRRLTHEARDDLVHDWLPDGSALVGVSARWSPRGDGDYDIAVFDTATGRARPLTSGPAHDTSPRASPDGTRVAFLRESVDIPPQICVTTMDGTSEPECRLISGRMASLLLGWISPVELALTLSESARHPLVILDWERNTTTELLGPEVARALLSPDRRWVVAGLRREGVRGETDWIVPLDHPNRGRSVVKSDGNAKLTRWWEGRGDASAVIARIEMADTASVLPYGTDTQLRVRAFTEAGAEVPVYVPITWSTSDPRVATVTANGEVRPVGKGTVTVTASLAGVRQVQREFRIGGEPAVTILRERWDQTWRDRWLIWGDPSPRVEQGPGGVRAFANHGDGIFQSMGVLRRSLSAREGLGVEVRVSTPLTHTKWQRLRVGLTSGLDTNALMAADQRRGPPVLPRADVTCGADYPEPGEWGKSHLGAVGGMSSVIDVSPWALVMRSGAWWTLRLQILPDGRCGVAVNGKAVWLSREPILIDGEFRVRLGDESAGTALLHGPLEVWTGVRTDVDWSRRP